jgi:hypothetical protein
VNRNIFVIAMDDFNKETMDGLREADRYHFHSLLPQGKVLKADSYDYDALLRDADEELQEFGDSVDAIVTWWDFPSTGLLPVLSELWDLHGPDLRSVVALEHKFWSRLEQRAVANPHVPSFAAFDPFEDDALTRIKNQGVEYPFWVKPVKSVGSYLGFKIEGPEDFEQAMEKTRAEIAQFGDPFQRVMDRVDVPPTVAALGAHACVAEGIIGGWQATVEGYVSCEDVTCYGIIDSIREPGSSTFRGYQYPSRLPLPIRKNMMQISEDVVRQVGLDDSCFNVEFFYDEQEGHLWLLEVNTRLSQSHSDMFAKVDGASNQRAMLDVAQGRSPRMPYRKGEYGAAGKLYLRAFEDGVVASVPDESDIRKVAERFPGTRVNIDVEPGQRLSELNVQESYSYELGHVFVGAENHEQLDERFEEIKRMLPIELEP